MSVVIATVMSLTTTLGPLFGLAPLPVVFVPILGLIVLAEVAAAELVKHWFDQH